MKNGLPIDIDLPDGFLLPETRCGFLVTEKMKALWAVQLDILVKILHLCEKHNLKIWMTGGSLLGVVRHKGYIPWDDDIDLTMPRADFKRFCRFAARELPSDLFFQTQYTDFAFHIGMAWRASRMDVREVHFRIGR